MQLIYQLNSLRWHYPDQVLWVEVIQLPLSRIHSAPQ